MFIATRTQFKMIHDVVLACMVIVVGAADTTSTSYDVLVYGSTPSGIMAAVAAARHGAVVGMLSQRVHIGGVCSGGLGQTDIGDCADEVIGGLAKEFFLRNAKHYATPQPRAPWNLEPHVAKEVFLEMMNESGVALLPADQINEVATSKGNREHGIAPKITQLTTLNGSIYTAKVFIDASYEGDLLARTKGVSYTYGRESEAQFNESGAGSQGTAVPYGIEYMDPFGPDGSLLPLLKPGMPLPKGESDKQIQAYNFRLCVTDNTSLRVPFTEPSSYNASQWELLRRFWIGWANSTNPHKAAQGAVPTAILGQIPSSTGARKYDANNCGYNPIHTDMIGGSWMYPEANYTEREAIWQSHVDYTQGFLWFMSSDDAVPEAIRSEYRDGWGYCGDEFVETNHFPPQLYIREARRLVGDTVLTQNMVQNKVSIGNWSIGMGCYNFDSHCEERYACTNPDLCKLYDKPYVALQCGCNVPNPGIYQIPASIVLPRKDEVSNLLVPVCSSASHVAYATIRMEPQFMIIGHAAGIIAALTVNATDGPAVQDVDAGVLQALLRADGQITSGKPIVPLYGCQTGFSGLSKCLVYPTRSSHKGTATNCSGLCPTLLETQWLALRDHYNAPINVSSTELVSKFSTFLKKSEAISGSLPSADVQDVGVPNASEAITLYLAKPVVEFDAEYYLIDCAHENCSSSK